MLLDLYRDPLSSSSILYLLSSVLWFCGSAALGALFSVLCSLFSVTRVASEHLEQPGLLADALQRAGHMRVAAMAVDIHQEDILAQHLFRGPRLELGHIDIGLG